ncbi:MAG: alkaline phosphatase family protein [Bryobacteraceae bacterium]
MRILTAWFLVSCFCIFAVQAQIPHFEHIVIIVQENRTPDNLFQGLCSASVVRVAPCSTIPTRSQYNIQTTNWLDKTSPTGVTQPKPVALAGKYDLGHYHGAFVDMCDVDSTTGTCRNDGAASIKCSPAADCPAKPQFAYVDNSTGEVDPYLNIARQYGWANYMFQTNQGPSFPAHQFLFGGTSAPTAADDAAGTFVSENTYGVSTLAGCAAPVGTTVLLITADGKQDQEIYPCFEHQTVPDLLPPSITWRYYTPDANSIWTAPNAISHICESTGPGGQCVGRDWLDNVDLTPAHVLKDIAACNLRSVSWVIPTGYNSDHAGANDGGGPSWVASVVNAIGSSSSCDGNKGYWQDTAILITWDDWGGWYDHEPPKFLPQPQGDYQYGFRVPLLVVSAYTPEGYINNVQHDFGSILRFIEFNFDLPIGGLNFADARAKTDLVGFFDLGRRPRPFYPISARLGADFFMNDKRAPTDPDDDN